MEVMDYDLLSIQEARILAERARDARQKMAEFTQEHLDRIVEGMIRKITGHLKELAVSSAEETDYGCWEDKLIKNTFVCQALPEALRDMRCVGIIREDSVRKIMDVGVPMGVIIALPPATSPVSTTIYKALIAVKSGNAILFSPHPRAQKVIGKTLDILIEAAEEEGLPQGGIAYLHTITNSGTVELMNHEAISLIINTGVPTMLKAANRSGKPVIYGGAGNGPAFIERTADIEQAAKDIIASKTFDNGTVSAAEQAVVVDRPVAGKAKEALIQNGAYFMTKQESEKLSKFFFLTDGSLNPELVGICAQKLAKRAGFSVLEHVKVLVSEEQYVSDRNPYAKEKFCPALAYYVEDDWMHACEKCIELLLYQRQGHTLTIHSGDEEVIRQFALKKPVGRVLVNTAATFGSMGITTNLFPAMTLGSGSAGYGITSDNVSPMNLVYIRKVGYGVRKAPAVLQEWQEKQEKQEKQSDIRREDAENLKVLYQILEKALGGAFIERK